MKTTIGQHLKKELNQLDLGNQFSKKQFIRLHWGRIDYFIERSFDVAFCNAKKNFPTRTFECKSKIITRTK